eukprot:scaffold60580_cov66-Phaeocystis_antarctica.AAC.5
MPLGATNGCDDLVKTSARQSRHRLNRSSRVRPTSPSVSTVAAYWPAGGKTVTSVSKARRSFVSAATTSSSAASASRVKAAASNGIQNVLSCTTESKKLCCALRRCASSAVAGAAFFSSAHAWVKLPSLSSPL